MTKCIFLVKIKQWDFQTALKWLGQKEMLLQKRMLKENVQKWHKN